MIINLKLTGQHNTLPEAIVRVAKIAQNYFAPAG